MPQEDLTVSPPEWLRAVGDARDRGYTFFDWLSAVDETDREALISGLTALNAALAARAGES